MALRCSLQLLCLLVLAISAAGLEANLATMMEHRGQVIPLAPADDPKSKEARDEARINEPGPELDASGGKDANGESCQEEYMIEGDWCEEACADPESQLPRVGGATVGTCKAKGFTTFISSIQPAIFATEESDMKSLGEVNFQSDCNPHFRINHGLCETFCIAGQSMIHFAESRTGINPGTCVDKGYPKFVARAKMDIYVPTLGGGLPRKSERQRKNERKSQMRRERQNGKKRKEKRGRTNERKGKDLMRKDGK